MTTQHFQTRIECLLNPNWGEFSQLFRDFKPSEEIKYKAQFGKCTFQSYKFKIYLSRTETSVIDNEFAKVVAYLCGESCIKSCKKVYDFLKSAH